MSGNVACLSLPTQAPPNRHPLCDLFRPALSPSMAETDPGFKFSGIQSVKWINLYLIRT